MIKTININLGGFPFVVDENAYAALDRYLAALRRHFSASEGCDEIVADIEARLAELLHAAIKDKQIVGLADVERAIAVMGTPADFDNTTTANAGSMGSGSTSGQYHSTANQWQAGRRLFRNPDDKVIGGVCSGISAYLGITDPIWLRLIFLVAFFGFGSGFLLYIILLILLPKAETAAEKLAMRGEPVNVDNIAKKVEDDMRQFGSQFGAQANTFSNKFSDRANGFFHRLGGLITEVVENIGRVLGGSFGRFVAMFVTLIIVVVLFALWVTLNISFGLAQPIWSYLTNNYTVWLISYIALLVVVTLPFLGVLLACARVFFPRFRPNWMLSGALAVLWVAALITLFMSAAQFMTDFKIGHSETRDVPLGSISTNAPNTLTLDTPQNDNDFSGVVFDNIRLLDDKLVSDNVTVKLEAAPANAPFSLVQKTYARGRTEEDATKWAQAVQYAPTTTDSALVFPNTFIIPKGTRYRGQGVTMLLKVPIGKHIAYRRLAGLDHEAFANFESQVPADSIAHLIAAAGFYGDSDTDESDLRDRWYEKRDNLIDDDHRTHTWTMTSDGLISDEMTATATFGNMAKPKRRHGH